MWTVLIVQTKLSITSGRRMTCWPLGVSQAQGNCTTIIGRDSRCNCWWQIKISHSSQSPLQVDYQIIQHVRRWPIKHFRKWPAGVRSRFGDEMGFEYEMRFLSHFHADFILLPSTKKIWIESLPQSFGVNIVLLGFSEDAQRRISIEKAWTQLFLHLTLLNMDLSELTF